MTFKTDAYLVVLNPFSEYTRGERFQKGFTVFKISGKELIHVIS